MNNKKLEINNEVEFNQFVYKLVNEDGSYFYAIKKEVTQ